MTVGQRVPQAVKTASNKSRKLKSGLIIFIILLVFMLPAGCAKSPVIGDIDEQATVALIAFEAQPGGVNGVVYRKINNFSAFLGESEVPVLVVFYSALAPVNSLVIPRLEQMADDYQGKLKIAWIDANQEKSLADSFNTEILPQFTVVVGGVLKRSLIGYDDQGAIRLQTLLDAYLVKP